MHYRRIGVDVVLEPFIDATDRAADQMTETIQSLPALHGWPSRLEEVRLRPGSPFAGLALRDLDLTARYSATVLAIHRAGRTVRELNVRRTYGVTIVGIERQGDRVVLLGAPERVGEVKRMAQPAHPRNREMQA